MQSCYEHALVNLRPFEADRVQNCASRKHRTSSGSIGRRETNPKCRLPGICTFPPAPALIDKLSAERIRHRARHPPPETASTVRRECDLQSVPNRAHLKVL